jgi:hypothetical protein
MGMANSDGVSTAGGLEKSHGKNGFVVLDAYVGQERQTGEQEIEARNQRREGAG